jgi:hypothetical protein
MVEIPGSELVKRVLEDFRFSMFSVITEFHLTHQTDESKGQVDSSLELAMQTRDRHRGCRMHVKFQGIRDLHVRTSLGPQRPVIGLFLGDKSQDQWEGVRWEIGDCEHDDIHFYAREVEIIDAKMLSL